MSNINYKTMSKQELRQYFLQNRQDKKALQEYLARRHQDSQMITTADDPLFDSKIQEAISQKMNHNQDNTDAFH